MIDERYAKALAECVERGANHLDTFKPGWHKVIGEARDSLDIESCANCMLGKLFGSYYAIWVLRDEWLKAVDLRLAKESA